MALGILGAFYLRARFALSPDAVYNHAMAKLNADPAVLEVLGGPVLGAEGVLGVRALARRELREEVGHAAPAGRPAVDFGFADSLQRVARARALINQGL